MVLWTKFGPEHENRNNARLFRMRSRQRRCRLKSLEIRRASADVLPAMHGINFDEELEKILAHDARFPRDAYLFVREGLDYTQKMLGKPGKDDAPRHVSGQQLLKGIRDYALQQYGPMTLTVLAEWGVRRCEDFGEIVFNMVENSLLAKTDQDTRDDFKGGYDFEAAFRKPFLPNPAPSSLERPRSAEAKSTP
jgi:uncharacterized repeat protein (TIGR04138 family)